jgi:cold shock protein
MATGVVKLFHPARGFGLIQQDSGGPDVFVHATTVQMAGLKRLRKGQKVSFEICDNQVRPTARNLRVQGAKIVDSPEDQSALKADENSAEKDKESSIETVNAASGARANGSRKPISRTDLEQLLVASIRTSHPECGSLVGVIVEKITPASPGDTDWAVKGVRYGSADRRRCAAALSNSLNELQQRFQVVD